MDFPVMTPQFPDLIWTFLPLFFTLVSIRFWLLEESKMATTFATATAGLSYLVLLQPCAVISTVNHVSCYFWVDHFFSKHELVKNPVKRFECTAMTCG